MLARMTSEHAPRVLVAQIFQETHGFSPVPTEGGAFEIEHEQQMLVANRSAQYTLGGIIRGLEAGGAALVPAIAARASCGGKVTDAAYARIRDAIVAVAARGGFDGIALDLHGCTQTESLDSAELDLLARLRAVVGPGMPIVAGFDLHGHATHAMFSLLDFGSAYKTNPHGDAAETGERVAGELLRMLAGGPRAQGYFLRLPMLTSGNDETGSGPLHFLHQAARQWVEDSAGLLDYSIFNVNPFIDGAEVGQAIVAYEHGPDTGVAAALVSTLGRQLWQDRHQFVHTLATVAQLLQQHPRTSAALVIGDFGDRVLAGAPGDSAHLVAEVLRAPGRSVIAIVSDPESLRQCVAAGVGAELSLRLGGCSTPGLAPVPLRGTVRRLGDGTFTNRGPFMRGGTMRLGPHAVVQGENFVVVVTRDGVMSQDPGCFLDAGVSLDGADVIAVKSGYHFKLAFADHGACVTAQTPGLTGFFPAALPFRLCRPIYPLDPVVPDFTARPLQRG
jgi:microcystin degradation protein MlrC